MKKIKYPAIVILGLAIAACSHKFEEYNTDPNRSEVGTISPSGLMEQTVFYGAEGFMTRFRNITAEFMQYTATGTGTNATHRYVLASGDISGAWNHLAKWSANADHIYKLAVEKKDKNYQAVGLTLRALFVSNLTDIFGDIPFSEAYTIYEDKPITKMKFDEQKDIYTRLLEDLELANELYSPSGVIENASKDLLFNGDILKWKKFTNSLRLRLLMRLSNRDEAMNASSRFAEIVNNPGKHPIFTSAEDGAILYYTGVTPFLNTYGNDTDAGWNGKTASEFMIRSMREIKADPRLEMYYTKRGDEWGGRESGMPVGEMDNTSLAILNRTSLGTYTAPYAFMKYDELLFILSEAAFRGWIAGGNEQAKNYYERGIEESLRYWNIRAGDMIQSEELIVQSLNEYLRRNPYQTNLETIINEKFVALFWVGYEAWFDYNRTGYPNLTIGTATVNDGILPRRLEYPVNTRETNMENYQTVVSRYASKYRGGGDNMKTPVWWSLSAVETEIQ